MKRFKTTVFKISILLIIMSLGISSPLIVNAETISKTVDIKLENSGNNIFSVKWEDNDAELELISPDGVTINKENVEQYGSYKKNAEELKMQYVINNAVAGVWKMKIIKATDVELGKVSIDVTELKKILTVSDFKAVQIDDRSISFDWKVTNTEDEELDIIIGYDYDDYGYDGKELLSGHYNREDKIDVDVSEIIPDEYYFFIKVEDSKGIIAYKYSERLEVKNSEAPKSVEIKALTTQDNVVTIEWIPSEEDIKGYKIYLYLKDEQGYQFLEENEMDRAKVQYTSILPYIDSEYRIGVSSLKYNGLESKMSVKQFDFKKLQNIKANIGWPEREIINQKNIIIPIEIVNAHSFDVYHNDEIVMENIKENGGIKLSLIEGSNNIRFVIEDREGNKKTEERGYYLDSVAPQLNLDKDYSTEEIKDSSITISGRVENGAILMINSDKVAYDSIDGSFKYDFKLPVSNKKLSITAIDEAGNTSQYETDTEYLYFDVYKKYFSPTILGGLAIFILVTYYIKKRKDNNSEN